jgi:hypothetical protein
MGPAFGRKQILSVLAVAACFGALSVGGAFWGATSTATSTAKATVHHFDYSSGDGAGSTVVLTGAIGDFGHAVSVYPDGRIDPDHNSQLNVALTRGSFRIDLAGLDTMISPAVDHVPLNPVTCSGDVTVAGAAPVVTGSGTGAYRGITGRFDLTVTIAEIVAPSTCNLSEPRLGQAAFMTGSGTVSFG